MLRIVISTPDLGRRSFFLRQCVDDLNNLSYPGALTWRRAGAQLGWLNAISGAGLRAGQLFLKNRPMEQVFKFRGFDGQRASAGMVK